MKNRDRVINYLKDKQKIVKPDGTYRLTPAQARRVKQKSGQWAKRQRQSEEKT